MAQGGVAHTDGHHTVSYRGTHALGREIGPYDYTPRLHRLAFIKTVLHAIVLKGEAQNVAYALALYTFHYQRLLKGENSPFATWMSE